MPILIYNLHWMTFNIFLAVLAVLFGLLFLKTNNKAVRVITGVLWLVFLPNTIYLFTDLMHIIYQLPKVEGFEKGLLIVEHGVLQVIGFVTFILAFRPFERMLLWAKLHKQQQTIAIIVFNFIIAYGIVLGRVERINSWEVFTQIGSVLNSMANVLTKPELLALTILFGLFCNFFYFLFRDPIFNAAVRLRKNIVK